MRDSGETDSTGVFTISDAKAQEKLAEFQLAKPRFYVLNLLASAVAGGASYFHTSFNKRAFHFEYDGPTYTQSQLENLFDYILRSGNVSVQELAVAVNAARTVSSHIEIVSWNGEVCHRLDLQSNVLEVTILEKDEWMGKSAFNRVSVSESFQLNRTVQRWWGTLAEKGSLKDFGKLAPIELRLDEQTLEESYEVEASSCFSWARNNLHSPPYRIVEPDFQWNIQGRLSPPNEGYGDLASVVCFCDCASAEEVGLTILSNGVTFWRPQSEIGVPLACGLISGSFTKNLSHTDLATDEKLRQAIVHFSHQAEVQLIHRLQSGRPLPDHIVEIFYRWAPEFTQRLRKRTWLEEAAIIQVWMKEIEFLRDLQNEDLWQKFFLEFQEMLPGPNKDKAKQRLHRGLAVASVQEFESGRYLNCQSLLERMFLLETATKGDQQANLFATWQMARALAGQEFDRQGRLPPKIISLLLRLDGNPEQSLKFENSPSVQGLAYLALQEFGKARAFLTQDLAEHRNPQILESLSDCLALDPRSGKHDKAESVKFLEQAVLARQDAGLVKGWLTTYQLSQRSRSSLSMPKWLAYSASSSLSDWENPILKKHLESPFSMISRKRHSESGLAVEFQTALLALERELPQQHPLQSLARARCASELRTTGDWQQADRILARGDLLTKVSELLNRLQDGPESDLT